VSNDLSILIASNARAPKQVINVVIPNLSFGGAERIVLDLVDRWKYLRRTGYQISANLIVLSPSEGYPLPQQYSTIKVWPLFSVPEKERIQRAASIIHASGTTVVYAHLLRQNTLEEFWSLGISTIPVVHNMPERWSIAPHLFRRPEVPFLIAVSDAVANALRANRCNVPVVVILHEGPWSSVLSPRARANARRNLHLPDTELVVGMVGKFKGHKRYWLATEILVALNASTSTTLIIVGPWKEEPSESYTEHQLLQSRAVAMKIDHKLHCVGGSNEMRLFYAMFDVLLNTSTCEGLSISMLEAHSYGIPCVVTDVGGQSQGVLPGDSLVDVDAVPSLFAEAILRARMQKPKSPSLRPLMLAPRLWYWLTQMSDDASPYDDSVICLIACPSSELSSHLLLEFSGSCHSLLAKHPKPVESSLKRLDLSGDDLSSRSFALHLSTLFEEVERILDEVKHTKARVVCFWDLNIYLKLLLGKILSPLSIKLIDVSSDPTEPEVSADRLADAIAYSTREYTARVKRVVITAPEQLREHFMSPMNAEQSQ
jgi:glycosyltransferase involved in cell wall biosynthesis